MCCVVILLSLSQIAYKCVTMFFFLQMKLPDKGKNYFVVNIYIKNYNPTRTNKIWIKKKKALIFSGSFIFILTCFVGSSAKGDNLNHLKIIFEQFLHAQIWILACHE